jgi:hypothetical protein
VIALAIAYSKSRYLSWFRWFSTLIGSLGIALSTYYIFRSDTIALSTLFVGLAMLAWPLNIENAFHHPQKLGLLSERGSECQVDNNRCELKAIWACPWFVILSVRVESSPPRGWRVLLGKDVLPDQDWHGLGLWRVWRQRN